jgi:2-methylisocitrate lyase-like PEP mutase family enzyme
MRSSTRLRELLAREGAVVAPGVADALGARLVAQHGYEALYMTGAGTTAVRLGMPDVGLLTMSEMADNCGRIAEASGLPLVADADTGYGGVLNVRRTVRAYESAGVAGLHIEDQVIPKRCGHLMGKQLVPVEEMVSKVKAACDARHDPDTVIIARTDAISVDGLDCALERAAAYQDAGADAVFLDAPGPEHLSRICSRFRVPVVYNVAASGKTPLLPREEIERLGFKLIIYPNWILLAAIRAASHVLKTLKETGSIGSLVGEVASFREFFDLMGMPEVLAMEARYGVAEDARARY